MFKIRSLAKGDFLYHDNKRVEYSASPNRSGGHANGQPSILVMHYTAGSSARSSANWFANPAAKASAHITIGRDGEVIQSVPFDQRAWHAGKSSWTTSDGVKLSGLNSHSIGIELANAGACIATASGGWVNPLGVRVSSDDIVEARHKNGPVWFQSAGHVAEPGWEIYPAAQMRAAIDIATALVETYSLREIVGHDDISPSRKNDPGPAFDMAGFRGVVFGRSEDQADLYRVRPGTPDGLAIRTEPTKFSAKVQDQNLVPGTVVEFNESDGNWWFVTVLDANGNDQLDGWVYSKYLIEA
ncbi:MAG: N-acetylmuramoyl-L-alanine amidase [Rhodobacteraceae bacterium]|nr:N-acetylmuramoyl-L-alanine amidase [Paracoccaceae bacterium]